MEGEHETSLRATRRMACDNVHEGLDQHSAWLAGRAQGQVGVPAGQQSAQR